MEDRSKLLKTLNILYAEDDVIMRVNTSKTLELFCNKVFQTEDGKSALELFRKEDIHIVILDYVMPSMDGYSVAKEIRKVDKDIPIFITSSYTEKEKLMSMIGLNIIGYLEKPIDFNELMQTLKKCVEILMDNGMIKSSIGQGIEYDYINKNMIIEVVSEQEYDAKDRQSVGLIHDIEEDIFYGDVDINTLRNMIYRLRKKIDKDIIVTIKEIGYMLNIK